MRVDGQKSDGIDDGDALCHQYVEGSGEGVVAARMIRRVVFR